MNPARLLRVISSLVCQQELVMKRSIGAAVVVCVLTSAAPGLTGTAAAAPQHATRQKVDTGRATDFSSRRYYNRYYHYNRYYPFGRHYRGYHRPYYYARPYIYRPYPYDAPAPFTFGFGFGPYW
jgi:hypothetical protein